MMWQDKKCKKQTQGHTENHQLIPTYTGT